MSKYIKNYLTISGATEATDILSPNISYINDKKKLLMANIGDNKQLEIVVNGEGNPLIQEKSKYDYLTFTCIETGGISLSNYGTNTGTTKPNIQYSLNGGEWSAWDYSNIALTVNDVVKMKGINANGIGSSYSNYSQFTMTGKIAASGNIMSLIDGEKDGTKIIPGTGYCFYYLFSACSSLTTAPELPATTLTMDCYENMFYNCSGLTAAPALPATTLADSCYGAMFWGCTSLTIAPELPATILASSCYYYMFYGCSSLTAAPELPATTLTTQCYYYMFYGCSSLTAAPELPATNLAESCYSSMFNGCTSLTSAPSVLPATTLANRCYEYMFKSCKCLTSAPELPAMTLVSQCYNNMFNGCSNLSSVTCLATSGINKNNSTNNWLMGTKSSGTRTFTKAASATWPTGTSGIPSGWTVETA